MIKEELKMRKTVAILGLVFIAVAATFGQPSHRRSPVAPSLLRYPSVTPIHIGVKGSVVNNTMVYTALHSAQTPPLIMVDGGVAFEWSCFEHLSVGLDVTYASRGTRKTFKTEFLTNYQTSDFAHYDYRAKLRGIEGFLPISVYLDVHLPEDFTSFRNGLSKVYLFAGPEVYLPLSGSMDWKRYYSDGTIYSQYHVDATKASFTDYCYGFGVGIGFWHKDYHSFLIGKKNRPVNTFTISKIDFSCFIENNTFSASEMAGTVGNVYGWGDLEHETLGKRYNLVFKLNATILLPIKKKPSGSCSGIGTKSKKGASIKSE